MRWYSVSLLYTGKGDFFLEGRPSRASATRLRLGAMKFISANNAILVTANDQDNKYVMYEERQRFALLQKSCS
jgi:hypothetical protein